jgi:phosphoserine phosphatase
VFQHPSTTYNLICFDCDSTLTSIEGIDELARLKGQFERIAELTRRAMNGEIKFEEVFAKRLELIRPTRADLLRVGQAYIDAMLPDTKETVATLQAAGCDVHIVSGGLLPAVQRLARAIGIPNSNVHAVPVVFDELAGKWWQYDQHRYGGNPDERYLTFAPSPLAETNGKRQVIHGIANGTKKTMLIGDGTTDLETQDAVNLFVGFGGVVRRERVANEAGIYIQAPRLSAIVPLAISSAAAEKLDNTQHQTVLQHGLDDIERRLVTFK